MGTSHSPEENPDRDRHHLTINSEPSRAYLEQLEQDTERRKNELKHHLASHDGAADELHERLESSIEGQTTALGHVLHELHENPETAFQEHRAVKLIVDHLADHDIPAENPAFGLDTAIRAEVTSEDFDPACHRTIAIMSEYDALRRISCGRRFYGLATNTVESSDEQEKMLTADTRRKHRDQWKTSLTGLGQELVKGLQ